MPREYQSVSRTAFQRLPEYQRDDAWIRGFLREAKVGHIASVQDGQPFLNPTTFWFDEEEHQIIFHSNVAGRIRANIENNPRVCFEASELGKMLPANVALEFSLQFRSVTVFGKARLISDTEEARRVMKRLDPALPIYRALPLPVLMERAVTSQRMFRTLLQGFALAALVLATAGIYGVTSYWVAQRMSELGIRMALGARRAQLLGQVLRQAVALVLIGTALGLVGAFGAARALAGLLYGVRAEEPLLYLAAAAVLAVTAVMASLGPARRATSADPMLALRAE